MFNMKEGLLGQSSALKDMIGKMPDFAMNLFDWAQVAMNDLPLNPDGSRQKRSVWDAWLGTAEQPMRSLLTGKVVGEMTDESEKRDKLARGEAKTFKVKDEETHTEKEIVVSKWVKEEPGHRLGSLNFNSLPRGFHGTFTIMQWLAGNEKGPTGVFVDTQEMDYRYEDFKLATLKKKRKYIRIIGNGIVLSQGSPHLYEDAFGDATVIQRNLFRNIMLARIHSQTFAEGILNMKVKFFNPEGGGDAEVPAAVLIRAFVKEALKDNPRNEEELKKHYIDENATLRKLGKKGTPGVRDDISALLDEKFEPERVDLDGNTKSPQQYEKELEQMKYVGTIKGKNKF